MMTAMTMRGMRHLRSLLTVFVYISCLSIFPLPRHARCTYPCFSFFRVLVLLYRYRRVVSFFVSGLSLPCRRFPHPHTPLVLPKRRSRQVGERETYWPPPAFPMVAHTHAIHTTHHAGACVNWPTDQPTNQPSSRPVSHTRRSSPDKQSDWVQRGLSRSTSKMVTPSSRISKAKATCAK